ncbi:transposable element Tcb1 transposase [Trichonephila clavipes]|nr:transposable element Tcb1 transposase [Trichonephila clavipes]
MGILNEKPLTLDEKLEKVIYSKAKVLYCSTKKSTSSNKVMKQEMQFFDSTENPSTNIIKICETLKTIPATSVEAKRAFSAARSFVTKLRTRLSAKSHPRVTTPNEDRYLAVNAKRNRRSTASDLSRQLSLATGTRVSRQTVYRRLGHSGLYPRRPARCVPLTATHCRLRLIWSREHALWAAQQWSCVMFSDESRFSLHSDSHRTLIWRAPGTRYHQENIIE